jgi:anti-sigma B factor antagonist
VPTEGNVPTREKRTQVDDSFSVAVETGDGSTVVAVAGEVDVATAPELRDRLHEVISGDSPLLVVDLLGVTFIDSTALAVLIEALKQSDAKGATMRIVATEPRILKVFAITGLTEIFAIRATLEEAIAG